MHCAHSSFPASAPTGMAECLLTSARACVKLQPTTRPEDVAALADAGITAYHAVRKAVPLLSRARWPWWSAPAGWATSASSAWPP